MSIATLINPNKNDVYAKTVYADNLMINDITTTNITTTTITSDEYVFYPYGVNNKLSLFYSIRNNNVPLNQLSNAGINSNLVDIIYSQIGRNCMLSIIPTSASQIINNRRVMQPLPSGTCNIFLSEFGSTIGQLIYDATENLIILQGCGYYLDTSAIPYIRKTFNWTLEKGASIDFSVLSLTKSDYQEQLATPAWQSSDYLLSIIISFNSAD